MKNWIIWGAFILLFLCSGCLNTFYPIFTEKDLVSGQSLTGSWKNGDGKMIIEKAPGGLKIPEGLKPLSNRMLIIRNIDENGAERSRDLAFLVKIGDYYFLDRFPDYTPADQTMDPLYHSLFIKQHIIFRVNEAADGNTLELQRVSDKRIKEEIEKKEIRIKMLTREDGNIILASTEELQNHIRKYASDPVFYEGDNKKTFTRIP